MLSSRLTRLTRGFSTVAAPVAPAAPAKKPSNFWFLSSVVAGSAVVAVGINNLFGFATREGMNVRHHRKYQMERFGHTWNVEHPEELRAIRAKKSALERILTSILGYDWSIDFMFTSRRTYLENLEKAQATAAAAAPAPVPVAAAHHH